MRIDDLNRNSATQIQGAEKTEQAAQQGAAEKTVVADAGDQAEVSQLAQALASGDPSRVEQLRLQVQSGKYEVPAATLAASIIDAHSKE